MKKTISIRPAPSGKFMDKVRGLLPKGGNLTLCLTCGACASGCPATGLEGMDPRKFLRMVALGMDDEVRKSGDKIWGNLGTPYWEIWGHLTYF